MLANLVTHAAEAVQAFLPDRRDKARQNDNSLQPNAGRARTEHMKIDDLPAAGDMPPAGLLAERLQMDLRSDHAGETGAVWIYRGILAWARDPDIRRFATGHLETERRHLDFFERWLPRRLHSRLLPLWRVAGWSLGALSLLGGRRGVFLTIDAVETFVVEHYRRQIDYLEASGEHREIRAVLERFLQDEDHHRLDAANRSRAEEGWFARRWRALVGSGSRLAVVAAQRF